MKQQCKYCKAYYRVLEQNEDVRPDWCFSCDLHMGCIRSIERVVRGAYKAGKASNEYWADKLKLILL